jgi:RNA-binding protein
VDQTLRHRDLIKVKFEQFKEDRKELAALMAERSGSQLITLVGHVAVLYRPKPEGKEAEPKEPVEE